jgi:hypothetical protein
MTASSSSSVLSGLAETAVHRFLTTSNKFWLICGGTSLILVVGASGMAAGAVAAGMGFCL